MYSTQERLYLYNSYIKCNKSIALALRMYQKKFPNRRIPTRSIFVRIAQSLREHVVLAHSQRAKSRNVLTEEIQQMIALYFKVAPENSLRACSREMQVPKSTIHNSMRLNKYKPFKFTKLQYLHPNDNRRLEFCQNIMNRQFLDNIYGQKC
ncbi:hypothetical protein ABEB36_004785 [Hypothenemus hampei]|uniref:DUF4817 domain-containing protein n=1 Tax=Hypothenemus hampei TaxID=57062 RepID=A0ABD1EVU5_HYPHA